MTALVLNNFSLKIGNPFRKFMKAIMESRMKTAMVYVRDEMMKHKAYKDTYKELSKLSDRELADIGINRGVIHELSMEAYYKSVQ